MGDTATARTRVAASGADVLSADEPDAALNVRPQRGARVEQIDQALQQRPVETTTPMFVPCDEDAVSELQAAERSGILARFVSRATGQELALALDTKRGTETGVPLEQPLPISASEIDDWVALAEQKGLCGLVLAEECPHVMVMGPRGATVPSVRRFRDALMVANPSLCFLQLPATRVRVLTELTQTSFEDEVADLSEVRVAVIHPDHTVRSRWQRHMAFAGAEVLFDEVDDAALPTLGESAPDLLVVHEDAIGDLTRAGCWRDVRLQFSSLLVVSSPYADELHSHDLVAEAAHLLAAYANLQRQIAETDILVERVESLGPARWLRELQGCDGHIEMRVHAPQGAARVRMHNGELHEASYLRHGEELQGTDALSALREACFGCLVVGSPQQMADLDRSGRLAAMLGPASQQLATIAEPSLPAQCGSRGDPPSIMSSAAAEEQPKRAGRAGGTVRPRAIAAGAFALLAMVAVGTWVTAPTSRPKPAVVRPSAGATAHAARAVFKTPSPKAVARPPAAEGPVAPGATDVAEADAPLSVAPPGPEVAAPAVTDDAVTAEVSTAVQPEPDVAASGVSEASAEPTPGAAAPRIGPLAGALQPTPTVRAAAANAAVSELPIRLRRWLQPTPAQQRVIDAYWARVEKNFVKAERLLSEAHALDPKEAEAAYQLALTCARQGRLEQSLSWTRQASALSPLDPAPLALEGDIQVLRGRPVEAEQAWKQCLRVRPSDPGCVRRLAQLKARRGS